MANRAARRRKGQSKSPNFTADLKSRWQKWQSSKSPILIFLLKFLAVLVPFYVIWLTPFFKENILSAWNELNTYVASFVLNIFGADTVAKGVNLIGPTASIQVFEGCDGIEPTMLLVAGIVAFPATTRHKLRGLLFGSLFILGVNFLRIISLYIVQNKWPAGFDFMHLDFWQVFFILLALVTWAYWIQKSNPNPPSVDETPAE